MRRILEGLFGIELERLPIMGNRQYVVRQDIIRWVQTNSQIRLREEFPRILSALQLFAVLRQMAREFLVDGLPRIIIGTFVVFTDCCRYTVTRSLYMYFMSRFLHRFHGIVIRAT